MVALDSSEAFRCDVAGCDNSAAAATSADTPPLVEPMVEAAAVAADGDGDAAAAPCLAISNSSSRKSSCLIFSTCSRSRCWAKTSGR